METISLQAFMLYRPLRSCSDIPKNPQSHLRARVHGKAWCRQSAWQSLRTCFPLGNLAGRSSLFGSWGWWREAKRGGENPSHFETQAGVESVMGFLKIPSLFYVRAKFVKISSALAKTELRLISPRDANYDGIFESPTAFW